MERGYGMKTIVKWIAVVVWMFMAGSAYSAEPILIGHVASLTGMYSNVGKEMAFAINMAVEEINQKGGVLGRPLKVVQEDDETSPAVATRMAEKMILQDKVNFLIGTASSGVTLALMEVANKHKKVLMSPISQSIDITGSKKNKYTFRTCANPELTSAYLAKYMVQNLGKKVYLLTADYAWGRSTSEQYRKRIPESGGEVIGETFFPLGTKDFSLYFGKIKAAKPDVLFVAAASNDAISAVNQISQYGLKKMMKVCGDGSLISNDALSAQGKDADGIITVDYYSPGIDTPENKTFVEKFQERSKMSAGKFSVTTYESIYWLAQAIGKAGSIDSDKVVAALEGSSFSGPQGPKTMRTEDHQTLMNFYYMKAQDGKLVIFDKAGQ